MSTSGRLPRRECIRTASTTMSTTTSPTGYASEMACSSSPPVPVRYAGPSTSTQLASSNDAAMISPSTRARRPEAADVRNRRENHHTAASASGIAARYAASAADGNGAVAAEHELVEAPEHLAHGPRQAGGAEQRPRATIGAAAPRPTSTRRWRGRRRARCRRRRRRAVVCGPPIPVTRRVPKTTTARRPPRAGGPRPSSTPRQIPPANHGIVTEGPRPEGFRPDSAGPDSASRTPPSWDYAGRAPRTRRPGRAPVSRSSRRVTTPLTIVAT